MLIWNGIDVCSIGLPSGRVIACTREMPGTRKMALAILSMTRKSAELRRSWSLSIISSSGFIRAWREVPVGGRVALVGGQVGGQVVAVVVVGPVPGQGQQADQGRVAIVADQDRARASGRRRRRSCASRAPSSPAWARASCRTGWPP